MDRSEVDRKADAQARLAAECFMVEYLGDAHKEVYCQIQKLRRAANVGVHYSPYTTLVQSSCMGKTRCVMELSRLGVYVCYCSLAGKDSSAYPPRTDHLAGRLGESVSEVEMVLYLNAWLLVLADELKRGTSASEWKDMQLPGSDSVAGAVREKWEQLMASTSASEYEADKRDRDVVNLEIIGNAMKQVKELMDDDQYMDTDDQSCSTSDGPDWIDPRVIFVFDEARGLTVPSQVPFALLRRALRVFFGRGAYFALMIDTSAKIMSCDFLPRRSDEDSSRALKIGISLLPPIYYLPTLQLNMPKSGLSVKEYTAPSTWMKYGRPVWAARMARGSGDVEQVLTTELLPWAQQKLMGDIGAEFGAEGKMSESQAMALLAAATGLQVCPRCRLAEKMVASHLNVILRVSSDRSRLFVALPAEPILSEAAAGLLSRDDVKRNALMHMEAACLAGYATGGPRGEFVAKFVLVAAVWALARPGDWNLRPIKVANFFRKLLNVNTKTDKSTKAVFGEVVSRLPEDGLVFFNTFVVVGTVPDAAMLSRCFAGGVAITYQADDCVPGPELLVPIWTPRGMTCGVVSVGNEVGRGWWERAALESVRSRFTTVKVGAGLPMVTVIMSMPEPAVSDPSKAWLLWDEDRNYVQLTCYGLDGNYGYLSREVTSLLKNILVARPDPVKGAEACEAEWVKQMLPYQYQQVPQFLVQHGD